jgi:hypothetical protein
VPTRSSALPAIDDVVSDECSLAGIQSSLAQYFFERGQFVLNALVNIIQLQIASAQGHGFRDPLGDQPSLDSGQPSERNGRAILGMEALGFDQGLAHQAETAPPTKLGGMLLGRLLDSSGCGKDVQLAVGQNAVYVKEEQFDFLGASLGGLVLEQRRNSSIAQVGTAAWAVRTGDGDVPVILACDAKKTPRRCFAVGDFAE